MTNEQQPAVVLGPGYRIVAELETRGWTQKDLAEILGRPIQAINEIVKGAKQVTPETAIQLGEAFGTSAKLWLDLESNYRLQLAARRASVDDVGRRSRLYDLVPVPEIIRRNWIPKVASTAELERALWRFLRMEGPDDEPQTPVANLRATPARTPERRAKTAWIMRAYWLANGTKPRLKYDRRRLAESMDGLFRLADRAENVARIPHVLADVGVRIVFVPHLSQTYLDGAAFWIDRHPVVALTLRFDRLDYFWFTLGHELAHILAGTPQGVIDEGQGIADRPPAEEQADRVAQDWLIDPTQYRSFIRDARGHPTRQDVIAFAVAVNRHPSIILGRLQHDHVLTWSQFRDLHAGIKDRFTDLIDAPRVALPS